MEKIVNNPEVMKTFKIKNPEIYIDAAENILKFLCELNEVDVSETRSINWLNEVFQLEESCENKRLKILSEKFVVNNPECDLILNYMGKNWLSSDATDKENYKNKKMWNMAAEKFRESCIANIGEFIKEKIVKENIMFYLPERHKIVNN
jgi:hypothetical protein